MSKMWRSTPTVMILARDALKGFKFNFKITAFKRTEKISFYKSSLAFPGGSLEKQDESLGWINFFKQRHVKQKLFDYDLRNNNLEWEISQRLIAIRETFEERVVLCKSPYDPLNSAFSCLQRHDSFCDTLNLIPNILDTNEQSVWLTPNFYPRRFETAFLLVTLNSIPPVCPEVHEVQDFYEVQKLENRSQQHIARMGISMSQMRLWADADTFKAAINIDCHISCQVGYRNQITSCRPSEQALGYLWSELKVLPKLRGCFRCKAHITSNKTISPSTAYPGDTPDVIRYLTQPEQRMLSKVIPFVEIVHLKGLFRQYGIRGKEVLFPQDIFDIRKKLSNMPRLPNKTGIVIDTKSLQNLNVTRVFDALRWLIANNPLYRVVRVDNGVIMDDNDIIRMEQPKVVRNIHGINNEELEGEHKKIRAVSKFVGDSWYQINEIFDFSYTETFSLAFANILRPIISPLSAYFSSLMKYRFHSKQHQERLPKDDTYRTEDQVKESRRPGTPLNQAHLEQPELIKNEKVIEKVLNIAMSDEEFATAKSSMNTEQQEIFMHVTRKIQDQMNGGTERERLFISGGAGTGKTFILNLLKNQVNRCYGRQATQMAALTGIGAHLVGGQTIHSLLKLPVQKEEQITSLPVLTESFLRKMRQQWRNIEFLLIDEVSMVPYEVLAMIDARLRQIKNNNESFGGINVLFFGDLLQLPPIRGSQVFQQPPSMKPATHLWRLFSLMELTKNMRQKDDTFIDVLNALRIGEMQPQHMQVLLGRVGIEEKGVFSIEKALRIYPTRKQVDAHNQSVLKLFRDRKTETFKIVAHDTVLHATSNPENLYLEEATPDDINGTARLPKELEIFVGAKVMLTCNINISRGLVNGSIGYITKIIWPHFRRDQQDIPSVKIDFDRHGVHVIAPIIKLFPAKHSHGTLQRRMLPIMPSWAITMHKMQGNTVDYAVIDLGPQLFASGQAYVALSGVRSLDGLAILQIDGSKLTGKKLCNKEALEKMDRLRMQID